MLKSNLASSERGDSHTIMASLSVFVFVIFALGAQCSMSPTWHVTETTGCRSESDQDLKLKCSYPPNKCSLKIFLSFFSL